MKIHNYFSLQNSFSPERIWDALMDTSSVNMIRQIELNNSIVTFKTSNFKATIQYFGKFDSMKKKYF